MNKWKLIMNKWTRLYTSHIIVPNNAVCHIYQSMNSNQSLNKRKNKPYFTNSCERIVSFAGWLHLLMHRQASDSDRIGAIWLDREI